MKCHGTSRNDSFTSFENMCKTPSDICMVILKPPTLNWWSQHKEWKKQKERVKVRSAATIQVASGSKELGDQIARLMAALTSAEQGSHPASGPNSPRHKGHGRGWADRNTPVDPSSHNGWTGLSQTASICSSSATTREGADFQRRGNMQVQTSTQGGAQGTRDSNSLQCFRCHGLGHMARECTTPAKC